MKRRIQVGDRIKFLAITRTSNRKVIRTVTGFDETGGRPTVRFCGWKDFVVKPNEILEVIK